jgi:hypothetical protein
MVRRLDPPPHTDARAPQWYQHAALLCGHGRGCSARAGRFDFGRLPADAYEELCYLVVAIEFPQAVRLANPDGGLDSGIPHAGGTFSRCWQAKRFTGDIAWKKCEESLDAAVSNWGIEHCTFCFAKDLTASQHRTFHERLGGRHGGLPSTTGRTETSNRGS